jgi:hypothetical protein
VTSQTDTCYSAVTVTSQTDTCYSALTVTSQTDTPSTQDITK